MIFRLRIRIRRIRILPGNWVSLCFAWARNNTRMVIIAPVCDMPNSGEVVLWPNNGTMAKEHISNMPKQILNGIG